MSWNYRVFKTVHQMTDGTEEPLYTMREVHYRERNDDHPEAYTADAIDPAADSLDGLRWVLEHMLLALDKPVLTDEDFAGGVKD